ncbi:MAG: copper chaperone PCu(A)C [Sphingomicrobium sp.]
MSKAWVRDTGGRTATAAVFMTIESPQRDRLVGASSEVALRTDLMTMESADGTMSMSYVKGVDLPSGQKVALNPNGLHVWLEGLKRPLQAGETFPLTLKFRKAGERNISVTVIGTAATPPQ